jgi:hypothetical protein
MSIAVKHEKRIEMSVLSDILIYVLEPLFVVKNDDLSSSRENMTSPRFVHHFGRCVANWGACGER